MKRFIIKIDKKMYLKEIEIEQDENSLTGIRIIRMSFSEFEYSIFTDYSLGDDILRTLYIDYGIISEIEVVKE